MTDRALDVALVAVGNLTINLSGRRVDVVEVDTRGGLDEFTVDVMAQPLHDLLPCRPPAVDGQAHAVDIGSSRARQESNHRGDLLRAGQALHGD